MDRPIPRWQTDSLGMRLRIKVVIPVLVDMANTTVDM